MENKEILDWLRSDQDFHMGFALFVKYGKNKTLKTLFAKKGATKYNSQKLVHELGKLQQARPAPAPKARKNTRRILKAVAMPLAGNNVKVGSYEVPPVFSDIKVPKVDFAKLPDQLKHETIQRVKAYQEAWILHSKLGDQLSDAERGEMAERIVTLMDEVNRLWSRVDHYLKTGAIPIDKPRAKTPEVGTDPLSLVKRRINLRTYVSRANKWLKTSEDPVKRAKKEEDIGHWELELADIDKKLSAS